MQPIMPQHLQSPPNSRKLSVASIASPTEAIPAIPTPITALPTTTTTTRASIGQKQQFPVDFIIEQFPVQAKIAKRNLSSFVGTSQQPRESVIRLASPNRSNEHETNNIMHSNNTSTAISSSLQSTATNFFNSNQNPYFRSAHFSSNSSLASSQLSTPLLGSSPRILHSPKSQYALQLQPSYSQQHSEQTTNHRSSPFLEYCDSLDPQKPSYSSHMKKQENLRAYGVMFEQPASLNTIITSNLSFQNSLLTPRNNNNNNNNNNNYISTSASTNQQLSNLQQFHQQSQLNQRKKTYSTFTKPSRFIDELSAAATTSAASSAVKKTGSIPISSSSGASSARISSQNVGSQSAIGTPKRSKRPTNKMLTKELWADSYYQEVVRKSRLSQLSQDLRAEKSAFNTKETIKCMGEYFNNFFEYSNNSNKYHSSSVEPNIENHDENNNINKNNASNIMEENVSREGDVHQISGHRRTSRRSSNSSSSAASRNYENQLKLSSPSQQSCRFDNDSRIPAVAAVAAAAATFTQKPITPAFSQHAFRLKDDFVESYITRANTLSNQFVPPSHAAAEDTTTTTQNIASNPISLYFSGNQQNNNNNNNINGSSDFPAQKLGNDGKQQQQPSPSDDIHLWLYNTRISLKQIESMKKEKKNSNLSCKNFRQASEVESADQKKQNNNSNNKSNNHLGQFQSKFTSNSINNKTIFTPRNTTTLITNNQSMPLMAQKSGQRSPATIRSVMTANSNNHNNPRKSQNEDEAGMFKAKALNILNDCGKIQHEISLMKSSIILPENRHPKRRVVLK